MSGDTDFPPDIPDQHRDLALDDYGLYYFSDKYPLNSVTSYRIAKISFCGSFFFKLRFHYSDDRQNPCIMLNGRMIHLESLADLWIRWITI